MATTSTQQQTNGALIVSSIQHPLIPLSSASQLSSVNSTALANTQPSLITAQNQLTQQQLFQLSFPSPHEQFQSSNFHLQQSLYPQPMFLQQQPSLTLQQQQSSIQTTALNDQLSKKKVTKQPKIISKNSNQLQTQNLIKSGTNLQPQITQNNQAVVISPLPIQTQQQNMTANKKMIEPQNKPKQQIFTIQNNTLTSQLQQFKSAAHLQSLAQQSPQLINPHQLIGQIQQLPQSLTWAQPNSNTQTLVQSPIFIRQQAHTGTDGQPSFVIQQNSNPTALSMPTPFYVNHGNGIMHLLPNHPTNVQTQSIVTSSPSNNTTPSTPTNITTNKLKIIKPASQNLNASTSSQGSNPAPKQMTNKQAQPVEKKLTKKELLAQEKAKLAVKTTQQMNAEIIAINEKAINEKAKLQRSDSIKSVDSMKSKSESKTKKQFQQQQSSLDDDSSNSMNTNCSIKKSEKKMKQKAIVKPQILSHCVDGYIIHESSTPFPINITEELNDELEQIKLNNGEKIKCKKSKKKEKLTKSNKESLKNSSSSSSLSSQTQQPITNIIQEPQQVEPTPIDNKKVISESNLEEPVINKEKKTNVVSVAPISESTDLDESNVYNWSIDQVNEYLTKQDVSESIVKELHKAQIDGQSLMLLTIPILKDKFNLKLGPILSLNKKITELKEKSTPPENTNYLPPSGDKIKNWSVKDVYQFIFRLSSKEKFGQYAEEFKRQEMDGHSLCLIDINNIVNDMNIPFGPALIIFERIQEIKKASTSA